MDRLERRKNLKRFTDKEVDVLIATDLAARGLDFQNVNFVVNYHLPQEMENYLHRVGRTARAGKSGLVINFVTERDKPLMDQL
jgi:superfamily II DNA/RNA helicase